LEEVLILFFELMNILLGFVLGA